ncbi:hypothetical protein [Xanthomonas pisi]|uniref:hypothetical protein n=1 Tax=Xanthomonas pisi TaxID=56457 RepID=UPI0011B0D208|nr:hypothetical protein [Xanthomonas pisi]
MDSVTIEDAFAFYKATGCPIAKAREILERMEPILRERVLEACRMRPKRSSVLRDPIESDPAMAHTIEATAMEAKEFIASRGPLQRGSVHAIWREQARILAERHHITWFSPSK